MQNDDEVQDTPRPICVAGTTDVVDQEDPFHISALPFSSSATQNVEVGHEIASISLDPVASRLEGPDHDEPFQVMALPLLSAATQNVAVGHDTARSGFALSTFVGDDHEVPFQVRTFPDSSTAAQNDCEAQDTAFNWLDPSTSEA